MPTSSASGAICAETGCPSTPMTTAAVRRTSTAQERDIVGTRGAHATLHPARDLVAGVRSTSWTTGRVRAEARRLRSPSIEHGPAVIAARGAAADTSGPGQDHIAVVKSRHRSNVSVTVAVAVTVAVSARSAVSVTVVAVAVAVMPSQSPSPSPSPSVSSTPWSEVRSGAVVEVVVEVGVEVGGVVVGSGSEAVTRAVIVS